MAKRKTETKQADPQDIQELTERYNRLNKRKIEADANLKTAKKQLKALRVEAKREYGTADLDKLQSKLEELRKENIGKRADYQASLDDIEEKLKDIDSEHGQPTEVEIDEEPDE